MDLDRRLDLRDRLILSGIRHHDSSNATDYYAHVVSSTSRTVLPRGIDFRLKELFLAVADIAKLLLRFNVFQVGLRLVWAVGQDMLYLVNIG